MSLLSVSTLSSLFSSFSGLSEGSAVNVDVDASLFVQAGLFIVLLVILKPLLFDPMLKLFEEREERIEGTHRKRRDEDARSAKALAKYEAAMAKAREGAGVERDSLRNEGAKREAEIMAQVRAMTADTLATGRAAIASEAGAARTALNTEAATIGRAIASRVLGREVQS